MTSEGSTTQPVLTVRQLRRRWKPNKDRLAEIQPNHPAGIRFHRACSWLQRAEEQQGTEALDQVLLYQWVSLNALYGQWDPKTRNPQPDSVTLDRFVERMFALDSEDSLPAVLKEQRELVLAILDDEYLSKYYWDAPSPKQARRSRKVKFDASTWYLEGRWILLLDRVLERIYLLRCQLVHGAATCGSKLNRTALQRCTTMLSHLLPAMLTIFTDSAAEEDWGLLCYPPLD